MKTTAPYIFYYLTEDPSNPKELNEIDYLRSIGRVVVVTRGAPSFVRYEDGIKKLNLSNQSQAIARAYFLWTKICYLLCRSSDSHTDIGFPIRNLYTGNAIVRWLINSIWSIKYLGIFKKILPNYENLYFAPFRLCRIFVKDKNRSNSLFKRVIVHDSLILRLTKFTPFILMARRCGLSTLANVKSWDNPFYSQFIKGASGYLTWSPNMWSDIKQFHQIRSTAYHAWGPRPFYSFARTVQQSAYKPSNMPGTVAIGYAAAFCDTLMATHEVNVVTRIANFLISSGMDAEILFRPYPIVPISVYEPLRQYYNVQIVDIKGKALDRYGDGREIIRFGSDGERIEYLSRCHYFLSVGTSFTFEAALFGIPVIQYFKPKESRNNKHDLAFFGRLDISDHILKYLLPHLPVAKNCDEIVLLIKKFQTESSLRQHNENLMAALGFPAENCEWNSNLRQFISDLDLV